MQERMNQVAEFHSRIGETVAQSPCLLEHDCKIDAELACRLRQIVDSFDAQENRKSQLVRRALMAIEEIAEWIEAHCDEDLIAVADAWGDRTYVLIGDAVAAGLPADAIFDEVHRSNMTKFGANANSGKGTKSDGFQRPNLQNILLNPVIKKET